MRIRSLLQLEYEYTVMQDQVGLLLYQFCACYRCPDKAKLPEWSSIGQCRDGLQLVEALFGQLNAWPHELHIYIQPECGLAHAHMSMAVTKVSWRFSRSYTEQCLSVLYAAAVQNAQIHPSQPASQHTKYHMTCGNCHCGGVHDVDLYSSRHSVLHHLLH